MVFKYRIANSNKQKCILLLPLLMGFLIGILSIYTYYLLLNYEDGVNLIITVPKTHNLKINVNRQNYYQVDLKKSSVKHNISVLCLIFVNDNDLFIMQHNVWLEKCNNNIFVSKQKLQYFNNAITETYSENSWKCYCQTLIYLNKQYNSGIIKYDWVFLAKDNVWLIYENLIHLLSLLNTNKFYYGGSYINGLLSIHAGVIINSKTLISLANLLNNMNACHTSVSNNDNMLDFYLKKLKNITPISNVDSYGCTLFHSISLFNAFNVNSLKEKIFQACLSKWAVTFQLDLLPTSDYAMYYKYVLYKVRIVTEEDLSSPNSVVKLPTPKDEIIWQIEAHYDLNRDPTNMSQEEFFNLWWKKRQIIL